MSHTSDSMLAAIFDMDGLLIDSEPVWMSAEAQIMKDLYGIDLVKADLMPFQGRSTLAFCEGMAKRFPDAGIVVEDLLSGLLDRMGQMITTAALLPGAEAILHWFNDQKIPLAIASSSPLHFIEAVVSRHHLPVQMFTSGTEVSASKPHPAVFELCAQRLSTPVERCVVWEDSVNGVIAGKAASMAVVAVPEKNHSTPEKFAIADVCCNSLLESLEILKVDGFIWPISRR
jgi:beta-phosphoglucomutase-like phosphatase (HAD superfamily)